MSIKQLLSITFLGSIIGIGGISILNNRIDANTVALYKSQEARYQSYLLADQLRQSSDDLTRLARTYVLTGDDKYEKMYWDVLAIRNGEKPTPAQYERIYWDLVLTYGDQPRENEEAISLKKRMEDVGFSEEEFAKLTEAQNNSDALIHAETIAMNAVKGKFEDASGNFSIVGEPDLELARRLMHDDTYHREKAKIMKPIDDFFALLEARTSHQVNSNKASINTLMGYTNIFTGFILLALIGAFWYIKKEVIDRIIRVTEKTEALAEGGSLSSQLDTKRNDELGRLATAFNNLMHKLGSTMQSLESVVNSQSGSATTLATISRQNSDQAASQYQASEQIASGVDSLRYALDEMRNVASETHNITQDAQKEVSEGTLIMSKSDTQAHLLENKLGHAHTTIQELESSASNIATVLDVIRGIAEQTNLLALNAAIEAARAGEEGRGFAVVADEVRKLASRTQESTEQIDVMIARLQSNVSSAVSAMDEGVKLVDGTVQNVSNANTKFEVIQSSFDRIQQSIQQITSQVEQQAHTTNSLSNHSSDLKNIASDATESAVSLKNQAETMVTATQQIRSAVNAFQV